MSDSTNGSNGRPGTPEHRLRQYETMIETIPDCTYALDAAGRFTVVNDTFVETTGYSREDVLGEHASIVMSQADVETAEAAIEEVLADPEHDRSTFEMRLVTKAGDSVPCENHIATLLVEGRFCGTVGVLRDVTERRDRERALCDERAFVENVLDAIPDVFYLFDERGRFVRWNDRLSEITGYTDEEIATMHPLDFVPDEDAGTIAEAIATVVETGRSQTRDSRFVTKTGETVPYRFSGSLVTDAEGAVQGVIGTAQDVSERKEREHTLQALHDATRAMLAATTREAVCAVAANASKRVLGYPLTVVRLLDDDGDTLSPTATTPEVTERIGDRPAYSVRESVLGEAYEAGVSRVYDDLRALADGSIDEPELRDGQGDVIAETLADGSVDEPEPVRAAMYVPLGEHGVLSIGDARAGVFDATDEGLANVLAANTEAALDRVEREERLMARESELRRQNARLDEFASVVSHDIRNPLNVILGNAALVRKTDDLRYLDPIERAAERVNRLTEDLLTLARQGRTPNDPRPTRLAGLVEDAWAVVGRESARLVVEDALSDPSDSRGTVEADPVSLQQLFENLLTNAVEHGGANVTVEIGPLSGDTGFYVADDGPGIAPAERERVFDHDYTTSQNGIGLGLTIVGTVADVHDWTVTLTESDEGGARFEIRTD